MEFLDGFTGVKVFWGYGELNLGMLLNCPGFAPVCTHGRESVPWRPLQPLTPHSCALMAENELSM